MDMSSFTNQQFVERIKSPLQAEITALQARIAELERISEIQKLALDRYAPCGGHAGKARGGCLMCQGESQLAAVRAERDAFKSFYLAVDGARDGLKAALKLEHDRRSLALTSPEDANASGLRHQLDAAVAEERQWPEGMRRSRRQEDTDADRN